MAAPENLHPRVFDRIKKEDFCDIPACVESDGLRNFLEADIPAARSDSYFSKPLQSGMADKQKLDEASMSVCNVSGTEVHIS